MFHIGFETTQPLEDFRIFCHCGLVALGGQVMAVVKFDVTVGLIAVLYMGLVEMDRDWKVGVGIRS